MKKPKYIEELLKIIFSWFGAAFLCFGILGYIGVLRPTSSSRIQAPTLLGCCFGMIGIVFIVVGFSLGVIAAKKKKLHFELLTNGIRITGVVEKVYLQKYTQYGNEYEVYSKWVRGEVTAVVAMQLLSVKKSTFYKLVRNFRS